MIVIGILQMIMLIIILIPHVLITGLVVATRVGIYYASLHCFNSAYCQFKLPAALHRQRGEGRMR